MRISLRVKWAIAGLGALCGLVALAIAHGDIILCPRTGSDAVVPLVFAGCMFVFALSVIGFSGDNGNETKSKFYRMSVVVWTCLIVMLVSIVIGLASIFVWSIRSHGHFQALRYEHLPDDYSPFDWYVTLAFSLLSVIMLILQVSGKLSPRMGRFLSGKSRWDWLPGCLRRYW